MVTPEVERLLTELQNVQCLLADQGYDCHSVVSAPYQAGTLSFTLARTGRRGVDGLFCGHAVSLDEARAAEWRGQND
jgi:hypothetical protein